MLPPARNSVCLVLDEVTISMLADLLFPEDSSNDQLVFKHGHERRGWILEAPSYICMTFR